MPTSLRATLAHVEVGPAHQDGLITEFGWGQRYGFESESRTGKQAVWQFGIRYDDKAEWVTVTGYAIGDKVRGRAANKYCGGSAHNIGFYCVKAHTSSYDDEPGIGLNWRTYWSRGDWEVVPELKCAGPRGRCAQDAALVALGGWNFGWGTGYYWRLAYPSGGMNLPHLHFNHPAPGGYGLATSLWFAQNFFVRALRYAPVVGETAPVVISVEMVPVAGARHRWGLRLPAFSDDEKYPSLWCMPLSDPTQHIRYAEWDGADAGGAVNGQKPLEQIIWIEQLGPYLRIWLSTNGNGNTWIVKRPDVTDGQPIDCYLQIGVSGHQVMFLPQPLAYPPYAEARPKSYSAVPSGWSVSGFTLRNSAHVPGGTALALTWETDPLNARGYRPKLVATASEPYKRAICWRVDVETIPVFQAATGAMADKKIKRVRWSRNDRWQGCEFTGSLDATETATIPTWQGNEKAWLKVAKDPPLTDPVTPPTWIAKVMGYLDAPKTSIGKAVEATYIKQREYEFTARDGVVARLPKHTMMFSCSPCGQTLGPWFRATLLRAEVPAALILVPADLETIPIRDMDPMSEERFRYGHEQGVVQALDEVLDSLGLRWGVDKAGYYHPFRIPVYSGTPDWTLDEDTTTEEDYCWDLKSERSIEDFRNYVLAVAEVQGLEMFAIAADTGSHYTTSDKRYIGESWWKVVMSAESESAALAATRELEKSKRSAHRVAWSTPVKDLSPGQFVKVQVANLGIPTDTVFRIVEERGEILERDRGFSGLASYIGEVEVYA